MLLSLRTLICGACLFALGVGAEAAQPEGRRLAGVVRDATGSTDVLVGANGATLDIMLAVSSFFDRMSVTATKTRAADIQSTPIAVTVLPARTVEQLGVERVEGLAGGTRDGFVKDLDHPDHPLGRPTVSLTPVRRGLCQQLRPTRNGLIDVQLRA